MDFKQTKEVSSETTIKKEQAKSKANPDAEDLDELDKLMDWSQDYALVFADSGRGKGKGSEKGKGGGKNAILVIADMGPKGKGAGSKGKGKGAGKPVLAIQNGPEEDEEEEGSADEQGKKQVELDGAYQKCKSMQLLLTKTKMNIEELLPNFRKNPCANKHILESIATNIKDLDDRTKKTKQIIVSKKAGIEYIKKALTEAAGVIKDTQQWVSKIRLLSQDDAASVASKSKRSRTM